MTTSIDLSDAARQVASLLEEFGHGGVPFMTQATLWNHRLGGEDYVTIAIYVGLARAFRLEAGTLFEVMAKVRAELVARFGDVP